MAYEYDQEGNLVEVPNFSWVNNNVEPLKITVTKPQPAWVDATPGPLVNPDATPAEIAAYRLAKSVRRFDDSPQEKIIIPEQPKRPSYIMEPDLQERQGGMHLPVGLMQDDGGRFYYADDPSKTIPMVPRPGLLPIARTPDGLTFAMPKLLDLVGNVAGNVGGPLRVPAKAGEMVLGAGMVRKAEPITLDAFHGTNKDLNNLKSSTSGEFGPGVYLGDYADTAYMLGPRMGMVGTHLCRYC